MQKTRIAALLFFSMLMALSTGLGAATGLNASMPIEYNASCYIGMAEDNSSVPAVRLPDISVADTDEEQHAIFLATQSYAANNSMVDFQNFYGGREDLFDAQLDQTINILKLFMAIGIADDQSPCASESAPCVARFEVLKL